MGFVPEGIGVRDQTIQAIVTNHLIVVSGTNILVIAGFVPKAYIALPIEVVLMIGTLTVVRKVEQHA